MFILFGMPVAQILLFGFAITNEINNVDIAILDHSKDANTIEIINTISASKYFSIQQVIQKESDIEAVFQKGHVKAVLNFENDFGKNLIKNHKATIQIITDDTDPIQQTPLLIMSMPLFCSTKRNSTKIQPLPTKLYQKHAWCTILN